MRVYELEVSDGKQTQRLMFDSFAVMQASAMQLKAKHGFDVKVDPNSRLIMYTVSNAMIAAESFFGKFEI